VTILGDAGVGKTRLVRELWGRLAEEELPPIRRTGRCLSYGQGITYWPLAELLKEHFRILESDTPHIVAQRLEHRPFLGLTLGLAPPEDLHPLAVRERLHDSWVDFLEELARERPAVVLIEDLHWAEDDLCDLLETLVGQVRGPLLLLTTARPELLDRRPAWGGARRNASQFRLEALPPTDAGQLLDELLGIELPGSLREVVVERAEGNPFFVEELLATLIDTGVLERRNGGWSCGELPADFHVPDSVQAVLAARIDLLPPDEKAALQAASVIGRVFWTGPVYELVAGGRPDFGLLEERDFVRRRSGSSISGEREYVIKHALTREVAYGSLPKAKRAQLHAAFAAWLERSGEGDDEHASLLAHHYLEAVRPEDVDLAWAGQDEQAERLRERAITWARQAASLAVGRYEIDESLALLHRALELEADSAKLADLWLEIGRANALKYDGEAFLAAMEKAIEIGGASADLSTELALQTVRRAGMWQRQPDSEVVSSWIDRALKLSAEGSSNRAKALAARAVWEDDETAAREAYELAERLGDPELRSYALAGFAAAALAAGEFDRASKLEEQRLELLPEIGDPDHRADAYQSAAASHRGAGNFHAARRALALLEQTVEGLTPHHRIHGLGARIKTESDAGRWDAVLALTARTERAVEANLATPCPLNVGSLLLCAVASAQTGDEAGAERLESEAEGIGMEGYGFIFDPPRMRLALLREDREALRRLVDSLDPKYLEPWAFELEAAFLDALVALGDHERIEAEAPARVRPGTYGEPFALRALGVAREDERLLKEAEGRFQAMGLDWHAAETRKWLP